MVEVPFRIRLGALKIGAYGVQVASRSACAKETGQYRLGALNSHHWSTSMTLAFQAGKIGAVPI